MNILKAIYHNYRIDEFDSRDPEYVPQAPSVEEKYSYIKRYNKTLIFFSLISFITIQISFFQFLKHNDLLWPLYAYFILTVIYFLDSLVVNLFSKDFNVKKHKRIVAKWRSYLTGRVDIFLPTAGESIAVLQNTWDGIKELQETYQGKVLVYCLDDSNRKEVRFLAKIYGFHYKVRPKRGWFKKAGNLRHGYKISNGEFVAIFDADFRPRKDFLDEILPYFYEDKSIGLVQSPQYFDVNAKQNWLQRGAGAVQELFYRVSQVSRESHNASICVGSNAVYRRTALDDTGGTALIEHSEDVHTGFNMRMHGWKLKYIPIVLAKGLCPADMKAFFKQQYRWCLGSMTLFTSAKFWHTKLSLMARLSYFSGFLYYIHTAVSSFFVPIIPLVLILLYPDQVSLQNYLLILPSLFFVQIIYPMWHKATYGIEAWSTRYVYGWAHMSAIVDALTKQTMHWQPTGAKGGKDYRYNLFRLWQFIFNYIPAVVWVYLAAELVILRQQYVFLPLLIGGIYFYFVTAKVTFHFTHSVPSVDQNSFIAFWKVRARGAFLTVTTLLIIVAPFLWQFEANQKISQEKRADIERISQPSPALIVKNREIIKNSLVKNVLATQSAQLDKGYYLSVATQQDSYAAMLGRIFNTYSAETGDLLTLQERQLIEEYIISLYPKQVVKEGEEIKVSRQEMKLYVKAVRSVL